MAVGCAQELDGLAACKTLGRSRIDASRVNQSRAHVRLGIMALWGFWTVVIFEPAGRALLRIAQRYRAGVLSRDARRSTTPPVTLLTMWRGATARRAPRDELQADITVSQYREALDVGRLLDGRRTIPRAGRGGLTGEGDVKTA